MDFGYLQHKASDSGPFLTQKVVIKHEHPDNYLAFYEGRWRKVYVQLNSLYIKMDRKRIRITIEGV